MTVVWESSLTTHATIQAGALSVAVAASVAMLVKGIPLSEIWTKLPNVVAQQEKIWQEKHLDWLIDRTNYHSVSHALRTIFQDCDLYDVDSVREKIVEMAKETMKPGSKVHVNKGYCLLGGIHGIVSALLPDIDPKETLAEIVRLGYDTDTVAAIAGSILGARFGSAWIDVSKFLDRDSICIYADCLVNLKGIESLDEFIEREADLTRKSREFCQKVRYEKDEKELK